jgi:hypothetical protein
VQCRDLTVPDVAVGHNPSVTHRGEIPHIAGLPRPARPSAPSNVKISPHKLRDVSVRVSESPQCPKQKRFFLWRNEKQRGRARDAVFLSVPTLLVNPAPDLRRIS